MACRYSCRGRIEAVTGMNGVRGASPSESRRTYMMHLSSKAKSAVIVMLDLALHQRGDPLALSEVSQRVGFSTSYLEKLISELRNCGIVEAVRGPYGGYILTRPPKNISIAEIVQAFDPEDVTADAAGKGHLNEDHTESGAMKIARDILAALDQQARDYLESVSLQNAIDGTYTAKQI
ncbi:Rrf2 family transcriptional regulator [Herbaspirillum sp. HC18]|nr:Rrf2 family transcriptional regulator [Herbaspirillum sp. HC18]